jgi:hypothetical protein
MRLFLSYGHGEHTPLAQRLKSDLEHHNHEVWFDQARLTPGTDWERYIEDALDQLSAAPTATASTNSPAPAPVVCPSFPLVVGLWRAGNLARSRLFRRHAAVPAILPQAN